MKYNNKILGVARFIRATLLNWLVFKECLSPESSSLIETYSFCCWEESAVPHLGLRNTQMQRRSATSELGCCISNSFEIPDIWDSRGAIPEDLSAFIFFAFIPALPYRSLRLPLLFTAFRAGKYFGSMTGTG